MSAIPDSTFADPQQIIMDLQQQLAEVQRSLDQRTAERDEALARETATAEVLQVINSSHDDLAPVFDAMLEKAMRLCDAAFGGLWTFDEDRYVAVALRNVPKPYAEFLTKTSLMPGPGTGAYRLRYGERLVHNVDLVSEEPYRSGDPQRRALVDLGGARTALQVALRKEKGVLGVITVYRQEMRPFSENQITVLQNFAAQAVIAMENARLITELQQRTHDLQESLEYQTASSDVLKVISRSTFDLQPVLDTLVETAARICRANSGFIFRLQDGLCRMVGSFGIPSEYRDFQAQNPIPPGRGTLAGRTVLERRAVHIEDATIDREYTRAEAVQLGHQRTMLGVPLIRGEALIGVITLARSHVEPFTEKQIGLVTTFADQAIIAIENARLITETREALEQQTATAEVLEIINSSPGDLTPVFNVILEKAHSLCGIALGSLELYDGKRFRAVAARGLPDAFADTLRRGYPASDNPATRPLIEGGRFTHIRDLAETEYAITRSSAELHAARTLLCVPLRRDNALLGMMACGRREVRPFSEKEITLLESFAAQAVIAIENARLLNELRDLTHDLQESLEYQTAMSDVLKIISHSTFDLEPVLNSVAATVARLCGADMGVIAIRRGDVYQYVGAFSVDPELERIARPMEFVPSRGTLAGRVILTGQPVHIPDIAADPEYTLSQAVSIGRIRTAFGTPLLREGEPVGVIIIARYHVELFTERQLALMRTFADQAVIAIENARLLNEIRQRQAELRVTFDNMADGVAMFDARQRLAAWNRNFQQMLDLPDDILEARLSFAEYFDYLAKRGEYGSSELEAKLRHGIEETREDLRFERTRPDGRIVEVRRNAVPGGGFVLIYSDITERKRAEAEIRAARDAAETALRNLQAAQASLVQAQKMAALGQLTAGIAHEIKNPLNFVNNFAGLSIELLDELKESAAPGIATLDEDTRAEIDETVEMLTSNLDKIAEHGKRADNIVKSMLEHSRGVSGERREVDLNALVDEALNLAYHGARAQDQSFNITLERDFQPGLTLIELAPQEISRVFLNLFGNGFYAATKRRREGNDPRFRPTLKVTTRELTGWIEVHVRDNGTGIPPEIRDKLFQPFFTTKPTGEGTGLGLSISYDIITQQHGGTITVDSEPGAYSEFTIRLPRQQPMATAGRAA